MPISQANQVDYLFKKIGYGVAKTANATVKSPSNEKNGSSLTIRGDLIWVNSNQIPGTPPSSNSSVVTLYTDTVSSTVQTQNDGTSPSNVTWPTGLTNWIDPSFGSGYQVKVYYAPANTSTPQSTGTQLFPDGTGNSDEWFFDYDSGILNFPDNVPSAVNGTGRIYISGYRYTSTLGIQNMTNLTIGNISINGNTISGNSDITLSGNVTISSTTNSTNNYNGALHVAGGASISQDLWVAGNVYTNALVSENISILSVADPLLYLTANTPYPYNYDIGFYSHFVGGSSNVYQHTGLVRNYSDSTWYFFSNVPEPSAGIVDLGNVNAIYDTIRSGELILSNATPSVSYTTGALRVAGGAGFNGNINLTGNIVTSSNGYFTIPTGTTSQRPNVAQTGMIRYNSTISSFEGYGAGGAWSSLGGVKSVDGHAYIIAEAFAGAGDDVLRFYAGDTGASTQVMWASNANITILSSSVSTSSNTGALQVIGGAGILGNLYIGGITNIASNAVIGGNISVAGNITSTEFVGNINADLISPYQTAVTTFNSNSAVGIPVGDSNSRPTNPKNGYFRYNTDTHTLEVYSNSNWLPMLNQITDQQIIPDGTSDTYTLSQNATTSGIIVSINGVVQFPGTSYSVSGNQITFTEIPLTTDNVDIRFIAAAISLSLTNQVTGDLVASGNVSAQNFLYSNGVSILSGVASTYSNSNVAAYLPTDSTINSIQANIGAFESYANLTFSTSNYSNVNVAAYLSTNSSDIRAKNTTLTGNLTIAGNTTINGSAVAINTVATILDSWDSGVYRSARYTVSGSNGTDAHMSEVLLLQNSGSSLVTTFGVLNTGSNITYSSNVNGSTVNLLATGSVSNYQLRIQKTYFAV
jgi:hypothetical protein